MIDLRLYRFGLLLVPLAAAIAMFSLKGVPQPLSPSIPPDAFDPATAAPLAKQLTLAAPNPAPGSASDAAMADRVGAAFAAIDGVTVSEQRFDGSFHGHSVHLRNLIAVLPGESNRQIALIAPRDVASGSGAVTSAASTAALLEIAQAFSGTSHHKTLVFVSTDGSSIGALGAKKFVDGYSDAGLLDAAIVLTQPAVTHPASPLVIPWSTGPQSTASQLGETADSTVSKEANHPAGDEGPLSDLFRLALPAGLGEQGPLIAAGVPAVRLSSDGELPIAPADDTQEQFSADTFDRFGRAALSLVLALDASPGAVQHGPDAYIGLAGNLLPGWTIAMLALALLVPVALAAGSGLASAAASPIEAVRGLLWAALRALPFLGALVLLLAAAVVGLMPSPDFPFDPSSASLGVGGTVTVVAAILAYCAIAFFLRPLRGPPAAAAPTATPASLTLACLGTLGVWLVNPYLGLLVAVMLQAWLAAVAVRAAGRWGAAGFVLLGLVPLMALAANLAGRFHAGAGVWHDLLLMIADGQIGFSLAFLGCLVAGSGVAIVAAAGRGPASSAGKPGVGSEITVSRQAFPAEPDLHDEPDEVEEPEEPPEPEPEPAQPERDPRLWSKPRGSSSPPAGRRRVTPFPSVA